MISLAVSKITTKITSRASCTLAIVSSLAILIPTSSAAQNQLDLSELSFEAYALVESTAPNRPSSPSATIPTIIATEGAASSSDNSQQQNNLEDINQYLLAIDELQTLQGPFAAGLPEQLEALARAYQNMGNHTAAIEQFNSAQHIMRVNNGLFILDQIPLVNHLIDSNRAQNNFPEIDKYHGYLFFLHQRNYSANDTEMINATLDWAQWNIDAYVQSGSGVYPSDFQSNAINLADDPKNFIAIQDSFTGSYYFIPRQGLYSIDGINFQGTLLSSTTLEQDTRSSAINIQRLINPHLREAQLQFEAIEEQLSQLSMDAERPLTAESLQLKLADAAYQIKTQIGFLETGARPGNYIYSQGLRRTSYRLNPMVNRSYISIKKSLDEIVSTLQEEPQSDPSALAQAILNLADWQIAFDFPQRAYTNYQLAYDVLNDAGYSSEETYAVLSPKALITAPAFATHSFTNKQWAADPQPPTVYKGYVDLSFFYSHGSAGRIEIIDSSEDMPSEVQAILIQYLETQTFRPIFKDGLVQKQANFNLTFYFNY